MTSINQYNNLCLVRHGSGNGLGELAKALKKLIEEAIEKAYTTNVDALLKALDSAKSYKCCKDKVAEIEQLKETKISTNGSLNMLLQRVKDLNECSKSHLDDSQQKAYRDITSKLDQLVKLKEGLTGFTNETQCKDLLTNLCTGLETFLGFNSESKGYNGSGIVYSDLERLCDGVMGFLHGVLESVKDDDAVKTYDNKAENIEKVIKKLEDSIGTGRNGLVDSVGEVKGWLEGYDKNLRTSTYLVTHELDGLNEFISGKRVYGIHDVQSLQDQLKTWTEVVKKIDEHVKQNIISNVDKLDDALKRSVMNKVDTLSASINLLLDSARNDTFKWQAEEVDKLLVNQETHLSDSIEASSKHVQHTLREEFGKILKEIGNLKREKIDRFNDINNMFNGKDGLLKRFDGEYKSGVIWCLENLTEIVKEIYTSLKQKKVGLAALVIDAQRHFQNIKVSVGRRNTGPPGSIDFDWDNLKAKIKGLVDKIKGEGEAVLGVPHTNGIQQILKGVTKYAGDFDQQFFGEKVVDKWIGDILQNNNRVKRLLAQYIKDDMVATGAPNKLKNILSETNTDLHTDTITGFATLIRKQLVTMIGDAYFAKIQISSTTDVSDITKNMSAVKNACEYFANKLGEKLESPGTVKIAYNIAKEFEKQVLKIDHQDFTAPNPHLQDAVQRILPTLQGLLQHYATEMNKFVTACQLEVNLKQIGVSVAEVSKEFDGGNLGQYGKIITGKLEEVKSNIDSLTPILIQTDGRLKSEIEKLQDVLTTLNTLKKDKDSVGSIAYYQENMDKLMEQLRSEIQKVAAVVTAADVVLGQAIDALQNAWNTADTEAQEAVSALKDNLIGKVKQAFHLLTQQVQKLFANGHQADMTALGELVTTQKQAIDEIIRKDKNNGLKGLLKWLYKNKGKQLGEIENIVNKPAEQPLQHSKRFKKLSTSFQEYVDKSFDYIEYQVMTPKGDNTLDKSGNEQSGHVRTVKNNMDALLNHLKLNADKTYNFDDVFNTLLSNLINAVSSLSPTFTSPSPLLAPLKSGLSAFTQQLGHAYVNRYSGRKRSDEWVVKDDSTPKDNPPKDKTEQKYKLTTEGRNCAKVCLTIVEMVKTDLDELHEKCKDNGEWNNKNICIVSGDKSINDLGHFLKRCGYGVPSNDGVQDNELRSKTMNGNEILAKLVQDNLTIRDRFRLIDTVETLCNHLHDYYRVRHLVPTTTTKYPSSVYEMLQWLGGLSSNPVYNALSNDGFSDLFEKPEEEDADQDTFGVSINVDPDSLPAYPETISATGLSQILTEVCSGAHDVLTSILGHGHADGRYACEFNTNEDRLSYPTDMNTLVCWLIDIIKRIHHQLYFLYQQCHYRTDFGGWSDCYYGQHIGGSSWECNTIQCPNQMGNQKHNQRCDQNCDQNAKCGIKSPLQSFLEDGLSGFMPHQLKYVKGKIECSLKNHSSTPCKAPMGFVDISYMASHKQMGKHIYVALAKYCGDESSPLSRLCSQLSCLLPSAPKSLGDMFGFYLNLLSGWNNANSDRKVHRETAFEKSVKDANFENATTTLKINPMFHSQYHGSDSNIPHLKGDLYTLVYCNPDSTPSHPCGSYLRPICQDTCNTFNEKNADKYLSWFVYLTETFHQLLEELYEECCKNCDSAGSSCRSSKCNAACVARNSPMSPEFTHKKSCKSIVNCRLMRPTLCRYGFVFKSSYELSGSNNIKSKRTCKDFCNALEKVVNKQEKFQRVLAEMVYRTIPKFLWDIREKFFWTTVALWLLSVLYLLHIMVIRLDLLHIKSHLHSPSSHRIAAQSLLSAARVNKLNRVFYLQP